MSIALAPGFTEPVFDAQRVFRAVMEATARPATVQPLATDLAPPAPLTPELAAVALALADHEAPLWLDAALAAVPAVAAYLRFHTGARVVETPDEAAFALVAEPGAMPPLGAFAVGTDEYPDRSTTVVMAVRTLAAGQGLACEGPGILDRADIAIAPLPGDFLAQRAANRALFPRGIDCLFVAPGSVAALPRTTQILPEG